VKRIILARIIAGLVFIEGFFSLVCFSIRRNIIEIPFSEFTNIYKGTTLFGITLMIIIMIMGGFVFFILMINRDWSFSIFTKLEPYFYSSRWLYILVILLILSSLIMGQFFFQTEATENTQQIAFLVINQPLFLWFSLVSLEGLLGLLIISGRAKKLKSPDVYRPVLIFLVLFSLAFGLIQMGFGYNNINTEKYNFDLTGFPIIGYQVILACIIAALGLLLEKWLNKHQGTNKWASPRFKDIAAGTALFLTAFLIWKGIPLSENTFFDQQRPPNYEYYPNSDALKYDRTAQSLLAVGEFRTYLGDENFPIGYRPALAYFKVIPQQTMQDRVIINPIGHRPALVFFQVILHRIAGLGYEEIINLQLAVFSLLPVLIYILGNSLHSRAAGLLAAVLIILRERNALLLGGVITGVNSKLLMSEIPTMMGIVLFLILFIQWLKRPDQRTIFPLLSGGALGATMLVREEAAVILAFAAVGAALYLHKKFGIFLKNMVMVGIGILLVITPWIYRNWDKTGFVYLIRPSNQIDLITDTLEIDPDQIKPEDSNLLRYDQFLVTDVTPLNRNEIKIAQPSGSSVYLKSLARNPGINDDDGLNSTLDLLLNHFANQTIQSVVYLPSNPLILDMNYLAKMATGMLDRYYGDFFNSPRIYVKTLPYWWTDWDGGIPRQSILAVSLTLALISIGISGVWREHGWIVSIPWLALLAHILIYAWIRRSGGRYLQSMDWITALFYSIGLVELIRFCMRELGLLPARSDQNPEALPKLFSSKFALNIIPVGLFLLGASIPVVEYLAPNHYPEDSLEQKTSILLDTEGSPFLEQERRELTGFIDQGGQVVYARALYPRYIESGTEFSDVRPSVWGGLERDQLSRTEFYLAGTESLWGVLLREEPPTVFPHGSDVIAFGCEDSLGSFDTVVVVIYAESGDQVEDVLWRDGALEKVSGCPMPGMSIVEGITY